MRKIEFCDLKEQQRRIEKSLETRVRQVLDSGHFILGPEVRELEERLADFVGSPYCITCANGTDALQLALMALGIGPGDEVITSPFSFFATVEAILLLGAIPVFGDIDARTYLLDPSTVEPLITKKTKAIIGVSLYGQCCDLQAFSDMSRRHRIAFIEDAAQSFGAEQDGKRSCSVADLSCTSFFPSKPLGAYGDGGALFTRNQELAERLRAIRVHGQSKRYEHDLVGVNSRLDTLQAAILLSKLEIFEDEIRLRNEVAHRYETMLTNIVRTPFILPNHKSVWAQYTIEADERAAMQAHLQSKGIPTAIHYPKPLHRQKALLKAGLSMPSRPIAERAADRVMSLPMHAYMTEEQQYFIASAVKERAHRRSMDHRVDDSIDRSPLSLDMR